MDDMLEFIDLVGTENYQMTMALEVLDRHGIKYKIDNDQIHAKLIYRYDHTDVEIFISCGIPYILSIFYIDDASVVEYKKFNNLIDVLKDTIEDCFK